MDIGNLSEQITTGLLTTYRSGWELTIEDLAALIPGSHILRTENIEDLKAHEEAVFLFMGAGDIGKFQKAFEEVLV